MKRLTPLLLALAALGGCGDPYDSPDATPAAPAPATQSEAERAARSYAELARTLTPETLREQYRRQLAATTGSLRGALKQTGTPTKLEIRAAADDRQSATATVESAQVTVDGDQARATVQLRELVTAAGTVTSTTRPYVVQLRRADGRWLVTDFTAAP